MRDQLLQLCRPPALSARAPELQRGVGSRCDALSSSDTSTPPTTFHSVDLMSYHSDHVGMPGSNKMHA